MSSQGSCSRRPSHTILANRPALLSNFSDLSRWQEIPFGEPSGSLKECIDAALVVVITVNGLIEAGQMPKAFWFTHYISFCAISALYVYTIQQCLPNQASDPRRTIEQRNPLDTQLFEAATKCQKRIEDSTTMTSPFRRYNIVLDELKKEVIYRLGSGPSRPPSQDIPTAANALSCDVGLIRWHTINYAHKSVNNLPNCGQSSSTIDESMIMDLGAFGVQGELMGWSEFDSCAINWSEGLDDFDVGM